MANSTKSPKTKDWNAWIDAMVGGTMTLFVTGEVEVMAAHLEPHLSYHVPQGFNPQYLMLDLTIIATGKPGNQVVGFKKVKYTRTPVDKKDYTNVEIFWEGETIAEIKVEIIH